MAANNLCAEKSHQQRSQSISPVLHPIAFPGQRHHSSARTSLPIPIQQQHTLPRNGHSRQSSDPMLAHQHRMNAVEEEWSRSIPEAGYITLGTLRYGVRLSSAASSRVSTSCRNSDSIDTCSLLLPSHVTGREGHQRLKAESPTCGNCCVALTNGRCCGGSPCFGSSAPPPKHRRPRSDCHQVQLGPPKPYSTTVTRLPFPKNRTSAVSTVLSPTTISSSSASSEAHPSSLLRVTPTSSEVLSSLQAARQLKPPVPKSLPRTISKYENREELVRQPRRRSLSTEEEIRSIGCFNLRQSVQSKAKGGHQNSRTAAVAEKPTWLQICDPCHRVLERSLTPDLSDIVVVQRINSEWGHRRSDVKGATGPGNGEQSVDLELSDLRFIDSSAGDLQNNSNWQRPQKDLSNGQQRQQRLSNGQCNKEWQLVNGGGGYLSPADDKQATKEDRSQSVNNNRERGDLCKRENSSNNNNNNNNSVDEIIIDNKVCGRFLDVANNNLGEKERRIASVSLVPRISVPLADRQNCLSPEVERSQATQLTHPPCHDNGVASDESVVVGRNQQREDLIRSGRVKAANQGDSFEEDYERCIESINRQLKLETRDARASHRRTTCDNVTSLEPDCPLTTTDLQTAAGQQREGEEVIMEKRRNTFERFQRWGFGQRSASNNDLAAASANGEPKKKDKSERLKDLTELLKGTRIPSLSGFHRNTVRESSCSPPPVAPPRRQRSGFSVDKSFEKLESIEDIESTDGGGDGSVKLQNRKISVPAMKINGSSGSSSPGQVRSGKTLHLSISSPHFRLLLEKSQPPHTTDCNDIPVHAEEMFSLPKVEPKTIIGSYAQKNIPYRSASFSQVDFNSGKYSLGGADREQTHLKENRNSASVLDSSTYPRRRGDLRLLRNMKLGSPGPRVEPEHSIAEEGSPSPEHDERRMSVLETIESYDVEESVSEDLAVKGGAASDPVEEEPNKVPPTIVDEVPTLLTSKVIVKVSAENCEDKSEAEEGSPSDEKLYQTACEIPTPVFECCGKEGETVTEWFQLKGDSALSPDGELSVCKDCPDVEVTPSVNQTSPVLSASPPDPCRVEVRKRNTFSSDSGNSKQSSLEKNDDAPSEERKKIDKSKRRKGIYIQWPVAGKVPGDTSWDIDSPDCDIVLPRGPLKLNVNLGVDYDCLSTASCEPLTPDSDNFVQSHPQWPKKSSGQKNKSLTYQSSDEKDDGTPAKEVPKRSNLLRMDSTSDNESDRAPSRDLRSVSPSREDLKRYSKRPLRGPYGQMLEAEMKKATKVHYDEILDDLRASSELRTSPRVGRSNVSHSLDESAKNASNLSPKPRKTSAHLPIPFHERAASTPSQMDHQADGVDMCVVQKKFPNSVEKLYYDSVPPLKKYSETTRLQKSVFNSEAMLTATTHPLPSPVYSGNKQCKRTSSAIMDRSNRKRAEKTSHSPTDSVLRKHNSELVETPRGPMASNDLLAELLKGSSEKHHQQSMVGKRGPATATPTKTLPQAVLKCLDTRTHVVIELFNTEQSYVDSLHTVISKYLNPLKSSDHLRDIVDSQLVDEIFYMVPSILGIHERFLEELHKRLGAWDCNQRVGDAFIDVFSSSSVVEIYTCFVNNWNKAKSAIRQASAAKPAFARFLETMAREHKGKLSLDNLLIKPVQKFPNYELILSRLIKHTDGEHPDQSLLQEANRLVHNILMHLNCKEREALENGQREATLRELEVVIEGITDLVSPERSFLLFDLVSMFSGQTTRKERGLFLFSDVLVIASIKKRTGTTKRPNTCYASAVAATLDTNKYKFLTKMPLTELEISKAKDESVRKMMREIEHLSEDNLKIQKIIEIMNSIRFPHPMLEDSMRDLQKDVQKQLSERQANDTQLSILEFNLMSSDINQNMSILFSKPEKRNQWEEAFSLAKQKLATSFEKNAAPEFLSMIPIRKTRAGLQFTCAASTIGPMNDVWVCNSDGYVGQVCVLSLYPEPTVTSCNGVCNARILCVTSVPPSSYSEDATCASRESTTTSGSGDYDADEQQVPRAKGDNGLQLDSSSSSDNESDIEFSAQLNLSSLNPHLELHRDSFKEQSPALSAAPTMTNVSSTTSLAKSDAEEMDRTQSTMWLGTEDGCVHVYNCTDNIRIKKNKIKIQHSSAVYSILYLDNRVFVSLSNGDICVYLRDNSGWNTNSPITISVGAITSPVTKLLNVHGKIWCAIQGTIKVLNVQNLQIESQILISTESKPITNIVASSTNCVWVAIQNSSVIKCYHSTGHELLFEIDVSNPVNKMLSTCDDIIRQHKSACLRITSLLACKDLLWIGTSAGVLLNLPVSNSTKGLQHIVSSLQGISYGHTGHVRFLTSVELNCPSSVSSSSSSAANKVGSTPPVNNKPTTLVISGGDGYEDFRSSPASSANEVAGREDSTNHLLLWQI